MYSQTKQDIKNLRQNNGSHTCQDTNFQIFWPLDKTTESFKIKPPTVYSNFTVQSRAKQTHYTTLSVIARII